MAGGSKKKISEPLQVARKWVGDVQSGRNLNYGDRMEMYGLVWGLCTSSTGGAELDDIALWRAFEACVKLGIEQLLGSPSSIRELYSRLDAMAQFHAYASALSFGFSSFGRRLSDIMKSSDEYRWRKIEARKETQRDARVRLKLVLQDQLGLSPGLQHSPMDAKDPMRAVLKVMLQDQLGLSPVLQHSPMDAQNVESIETLLLPILAAHPARYSDWLLPAPYALEPLPSKVKLAFVLCSKRAESPVRQLSSRLIKRILGFATCHLHFGGDRSVTGDLWINGALVCKWL